MGEYSYINDGCELSNVIIGKYCSIASKVSIGVDAHPTDWLSTSPIQYNGSVRIFEKIKTRLSYNRNMNTNIGNDVWIGANAIIKKCIIIGAGAVVDKNVSPYSIVGGVPAKIIRFRFSPDVIEELLKIKWWNKSINET